MILSENPDFRWPVRRSGPTAHARSFRTAPNPSSHLKSTHGRLDALHNIPRQGARASGASAPSRLATDPDLGARCTAPQFQAEAHRQSLAVASSARVRTRPSSRPSRTGMTHEAQGDLNGLGRPGLRRQGRPRRHSPRRQLHRHGLDHDLRLHDRSNRRAPVPTADRPDRRRWTPVTSPSHLMVDKITTVAGVRVLHQVEPPRPGRG